MNKKYTSMLNKFIQGGSVVIDTSSLLLAGPNLLTAMPKCRIVIPSIVVRELEGKRSHPTVGFLAREWLRLLEELRVEFQGELSSGVVPPDYPHIELRVEPNHSNQESLPKYLQNGSADSTILAVTANLQNEEINSRGKVILLSNDLPMRIHATLDVKVPTFEFNATQAMLVKPFEGRDEISIENEEWLESDQIKPEKGIPLEDIVIDRCSAKVKSHNSLVITRLNDGSPGGAEVAHFWYSGGNIRRIKRRQRVNGVISRTLEQDMAFTYLLENPDNMPIVSIGGAAGTGKTLLSVAAGIQQLKSEVYQNIVVFRSLHEMGRGQELGFLPGDVDEKMEVWGGAIYDALDVIATSYHKDSKRRFHDKVKGRELRGLIEVSPITYLRGRNLSNSYVILDEAQNFSRNELLNILSRAGEGTKVVLCFDPYQVDNKFLQSGDRADIWSVVDSLKNEDIFAHITLTRIERSKTAAIASKLLSD